MREPRAMSERFRAGLSVFLWEAAVVIAAVAMALAISFVVLAIV